MSINRQVHNYCEHRYVNVTIDTGFSGPNSALVGLVVLSMKVTTFCVRAGFYLLCLENCKCDVLECIIVLKIYKNSSVKAGFYLYISILQNHFFSL